MQAQIKQYDQYFMICSYFVLHVYQVKNFKYSHSLHKFKEQMSDLFKGILIKN